MNNNDINHILNVVLFTWALIVTVLLAALGAIAGITVAGFLLGLATGGWIVYLRLRAPP
jgi:hypothetical protein